MTDLHLSGMFPEASAARLIEQMNALKPDLICLGGDLSETEADLETALKLLVRLRAPLGIFAVPGNNDWEHPRVQGIPLPDALAGVGITLLVDREAAMSLGENRLLIGGLNAFLCRTKPRRPLFETSGEHDFRIAMAHYPQSLFLHQRDFAALPHLGLAGHTHGGQFRFLGLTPYSIGFERAKKAHLMPCSGWTDKPGFPTLISNGIGTSRLPFRLNVPPMIHLITLVKNGKI